jgi:hypothetical protein
MVIDLSAHKPGTIVNKTIHAINSSTRNHIMYSCTSALLY